LKLRDKLKPAMDIDLKHSGLCLYNKFLAAIFKIYVQFVKKYCRCCVENFYYTELVVRNQISRLVNILCKNVQDFHKKIKKKIMLAY